MRPLVRHAYRATSRGLSPRHPLVPIAGASLCDARPPATVAGVSTPIFRLVCGPAALASAPEGWAAALLTDGHVSLLADDGGIEAISDAAHALGAEAVTVLRTEPTPALQEATVRKHAHGLPIIWIGTSFSDEARTWATDRGQMTLLVESDGALSDEERGRISRFAALLGKQAE